MSSLSYLSVLAVFLLKSLSFATPTTHLLNQPRTIWDGVYTSEQAARGAGTYRQKCGHCHRDNLSGGDGPPLTGPLFLSSWRDEQLTSLVMKIGKTMPQDSPESLTAATVVDIVAFVIKTNGCPSGQHELTADVDALDNIMITTKPDQ